MHPDDELPAGWLTQFRRGVLSGAGLLLLVTGLCTIPAFAVWLVPGADTAPAGSAVKAGALLALSGAHGGLLLNGTATSLTPLLITLLVGWLVVAQARRADSVSLVLGLPVGYAAASGLLAGWARLGPTRAPIWPSVLAAWLFVLVVGGLAHAGQRSWPRLPDRARGVLRAAAAAVAGYLLAGALLTAGTLIGHFSEAVALQRQLSPGAAGLPVALLGIAAMPNAMLAGVGYLTGPGFSVGAHTSASVLAVQHGRLPTFPLLAAVPSGRPATLAGVLSILLLALLLGWLVLRLLGPAGSWWERLVGAASASLLCASGLAALCALGSGNLGAGSLRGIGESWWQVGACSMLAMLFGTACWLAVAVLRGQPVAVVEDASSTPLREVPADRATPAAPAAPAGTATKVGGDSQPRAGEPTSKVGGGREPRAGESGAPTRKVG